VQIYGQFLPFAFRQFSARHTDINLEVHAIRIRRADHAPALVSVIHLATWPNADGQHLPELIEGFEQPLCLRILDVARVVLPRCQAAQGALFVCPGDLIHSSNTSYRAQDKAAK